MIGKNNCPFPYYNGGTKYSGTILKIPEECSTCTDMICSRSKSSDISTCPMGYNFFFVSSIDSWIIGLTILELGSNNSQRRTRFKYQKEKVIRRHLVENFINTMHEASKQEKEEIADAKTRFLDEYISAHCFEQDFIDKLQPEITKGLSFVHDYRQFNSQIAQNLNVIIETEVPDDIPIEQKVARVSFQLRAIYEASKLLDEKLSIARLLLQPQLLANHNECEYFSFHGLVLKYVRIYNARMQSKNITPKIYGESRNKISAIPWVTAIIPHTLIDNAIKYSPRGQEIIVYMQDRNDTGAHYIQFEVESYGPKILPQEKVKIFSPFFRGEEASASSEGSGYGLYISQKIAKEHFNSSIAVEQKEDDCIINKYYRTVFRVNIPIQSTISY